MLGARGLNGGRTRHQRGPRDEMIVFIDTYRAQFGDELICPVLRAAITGFHTPRAIGPPRPTSVGPGDSRRAAHRGDEDRAPAELLVLRRQQDARRHETARLAHWPRADPAANAQGRAKHSIMLCGKRIGSSTRPPSPTPHNPRASQPRHSQPTRNSTRGTSTRRMGRIPPLPQPGGRAQIAHRRRGHDTRPLQAAAQSSNRDSLP